MFIDKLLQEGKWEKNSVYGKWKMIKLYKCVSFPQFVNLKRLQFIGMMN